MRRFARRRGLDITRYTTADAATLDAAAAAGNELAVVTCTPEALLGLPPRQAALLRHDAGGWRVVGTWPYATGITPSRWQRNRRWPAICR